MHSEYMFEVETDRYGWGVPIHILYKEIAEEEVHAAALRLQERIQRGNLVRVDVKKKAPTIH